VRFVVLGEKELVFLKKTSHPLSPFSRNQSPPTHKVIRKKVRDVNAFVKKDGR